MWGCHIARHGLSVNWIYNPIWHQVLFVCFPHIPTSYSSYSDLSGWILHTLSYSFICRRTIIYDMIIHDHVGPQHKGCLAFNGCFSPCILWLGLSFHLGTDWQEECQHYFQSRWCMLELVSVLKACCNNIACALSVQLKKNVKQTSFPFFWSFLFWAGRKPITIIYTHLKSHIKPARWVKGTQSLPTDQLDFTTRTDITPLTHPLFKIPLWCTFVTAPVTPPALLG